MKARQPEVKLDRSPSQPLVGESAPYDDQAARFDERVGLSDDAVAALCDAIITEASDGLVVEIGAGTGRVGAALIAAGMRYRGIDRSRAMVEKFRERLPAGTRGSVLSVADGNQPWPIEDGSAQIVFGLRSLHHLVPAHACEQLVRVLKPGGVLLIGRVERSDDSLHTHMRRQMHALVRTQGYEPLQARRAAVSLVDHFVERGATVLPPRIVASWTRTKSPAALVDDWSEKRGLGGLTLPESVKRAILADLGAWAERSFEDFRAPQQWEERLVLIGARRNVAHQSQ